AHDSVLAIHVLTHPHPRAWPLRDMVFWGSPSEASVLRSVDRQMPLESDAVVPECSIELSPPRGLANLSEPLLKRLNFLPDIRNLHPPTRLVSGYRLAVQDVAVCDDNPGVEFLAEFKERKMRC